MNVLGWQILNDGDYLVDIPALSREEKELIAAAEERFKEASRLRDADSKEESESLVESILLKTAEELGIFLSREQEGYLARVAVMHIYGFAFLEELLQDPDIEEISVIGPQRPIYAFSRERGWRTVNACFDDERAIADMINRLARPLGRHITMQNPRLDAALPDGSRLHASLSPVSHGEITIRKFRERPFSPLELAKNGTLPLDALSLLSVLMQSACSHSCPLMREW
jgi:Flp pilus assembly CpaF family ATPase